MTIKRDVLIVEFDLDQNRIRLSRPVEGEERMILHTQYELHNLLRLSFSDAGRQIGEDILLSLEDLETLWPDGDTSSAEPDE